MLTEPLIQQLHQLRLAGMAAALEQQQAFPDLADRSFEDRLGIMIQHEFTERATHRLTMRLRWGEAAGPCLHRRHRYPQSPRPRPRAVRSSQRFGLDPRTLKRPHHRAHRCRQKLLGAQLLRTLPAARISPCAAFVYRAWSRSLPVTAPCSAARRSSDNWPKLIFCCSMILGSLP